MVDEMCRIFGQVGIESHVEGHGPIEAEAIGGIEELVGADTEVGEDGVYRRVTGFFEDRGEMREVRVEETDGAGEGFESGGGKFEITRVGVEGDEKARRAEMLAEGEGVAGAAEGAVDDGLAGGRIQVFENFPEEDGLVAG
jgi:hypothetical protein